MPVHHEGGEHGNFGNRFWSQRGLLHFQFKRQQFVILPDLQ